MPLQLLTSIWLMMFIGALQPATGQAEDMSAYLNETRRMVRDGNHEEALKRFVWFHKNALKHDSSMTGVRLSFALSDWKQLGDIYAPAREAMVALRDSNFRDMLKGTGDPRLFGDIVALNRELEEPGKSIELFKLIHERHPRTAKSCWLFIRDEVLEGGHYGLASQYIPNPYVAFQEQVKLYRRTTRIAAGKPWEDQIVKLKNRQLASRAVSLIKLSLSSGDEESASRIQKEALEIVDDPAIREALNKGSD